MKKLFGILIMVSVMGAAAYFALNRDNLSQYSFPQLGDKNTLIGIFERVKGSDFASSTLSKFDSMVNGKGGVIDAVAGRAQSLIDSAVTDLKLEAFKKVKDAVNEQVDNIGKNAGIAVGGSSAAETNPVAFSVKSGTSAYFTVINRENKVLDYEVDWQDGSRDSGKLAIGGKKVLSHSWARAGEYSIQFKITTIGEEKNYQFSVSIF